jgi:hypothetical protein
MAGVSLWVLYAGSHASAPGSYGRRTPLPSISYRLVGISVAVPEPARPGAIHVSFAGPRSPASGQRTIMLDVLMVLLGSAGFALMLGYAAICTRL